MAALILHLISVPWSRKTFQKTVNTRTTSIYLAPIVTSCEFRRDPCRSGPRIRVQADTLPSVHLLDHSSRLSSSTCSSSSSSSPTSIAARSHFLLFSLAVVAGSSSCACCNRRRASSDPSASCLLPVGVLRQQLPLIRLLAQVLPGSPRERLALVAQALVDHISLAAKPIALGLHALQDLS